MAIHAATTCAASVARRAPCAAVLPKRSAARAYLRAAPRQPTAAAAAAPAAAVPAATASQQHSNTLPFVRPGSAGRTAMISLDDQVPAVFVMPPPTGLRTAPLLVPSAPAAYGACTGDAWRATVTYVDLNANVDECFAGLDTEQCHQVSYLYFGDTIAALNAAATRLTPPTAAHTLRRLAAEAGALTLVAPGGTSALASLPACQLPALFQRAAACSSQLTAAGSHGAAIDTALAALQLLAHLRFGSRAAAEPYAAAACALKAALAAAATRSPAAAISERQVLSLVSTSARADSHLWLAPWVCPRWKDATEAHLTAGWSSGEAAVQYLEAWCALVARGRLHWAPAKFQAAAEAAVGHEALTPSQLGRLLAAEAALPAHLTTTVNAWLAGWTAGVAGRRATLVRVQAKAAATTALRARRAAAHSATAAVELAQGAPALAAFA